MAILTKKTMGKISGRVGNLVVRNYRKKKMVIGAVTNDFKMSFSEPSVKNRERFALCNFLGSGINKIYIYKNIWRDSGVEGNTIFNKINSINKYRIPDNMDYSNIMLVPAEDNFKVELDSYNIEYTPDSGFYITARLKPLSNSGMKTFNIKTVSAQGLVGCSDPPETEKVKKYYFAPLEPDVKPLELNSSLEFKFHFGDCDYLYSERYTKKSVLLNLITYNKKNEPFEASENIFISL